MRRVCKFLSRVDQPKRKYNLDWNTVLSNTAHRENIDKILKLKTDNPQTSFICANFLIQAYNNKNNNFQPHEYQEVLIKSSEFMDNIKTETHEILFLNATIAFHVHDGPKMKIIYEKLRELYYDKLWQMQTGDVYLMFLLSAHCAKWSDMKHYIKHLDEKEANFTQKYLSMIEDERDSFNYLTILELSQNRPDEFLEPAYQTLNFEKFEIMHQHTKQSRKDSLMPEIETSGSQTEDDWVTVDHEIPNMIIYGGCVAWFQLNGQVHLSGVQSKNLDVIQVKGRGIFEREEDTSHFTSEYTFKRISDLQYEGSHTRNVINQSKLDRTDVMKQIATFKFRTTLKKV